MQHSHVQYESKTHKVLFVRRTSNYGKIFPKRRDKNEKTAFGYIHDYYCVSYGVCRGMHRRYYKHNKSFICNINCYYDFKNNCNTDVERIIKSSAKSKDTDRNT